MAAYWGSQLLGGLPRSPDSTTPGSNGATPNVFRGGGMGGNGRQQSISGGGGGGGGGLYRHTIHPSVGNVSMYSGRPTGELAASAADVPAANWSGGSCGGGFSSGRQLWTARSDPAIAATGLRGDSYANISEPLPAMRSFTFLRLGPEILQPAYQTPWMKFIWKMREGGFVA